MKIGIVLAIEIDAIFTQFPNVKEIASDISFKVYKTNLNQHEIYIIITGVGMVYASIGTQYLISKHHVELILNYGVVGALKEEIAKFIKSKLEN